MGIRVIIPATLEPITLDEAKLQCNVESSDTTFDTLLGLFIAAARDKAEQYMHAAIMRRTLDMTLDRFPAPGEADISFAEQPPAWNAQVPLAAPISVTSVSYLDTAGAQQTLSTAAYSLDETVWPFWLLPAVDTDWPSTQDTANAVVVRYLVGYDAASKVPGGIRAWLLMTTAFLFAHREAFDLTGKAVEIPGRFIDSLLDPYRVFTV